MKLIVGLGNPGEKHAAQRHNIGFMVVDEIHRRFSFGSWQDKFHGAFSTGDIDGHKVGLLKPLTFMNDSGKSVQAAMAFYKTPLESLYVLHDEIDLEPLKLRIKQGGGEAGHNGLRSITQMLGNPNYWRIRIGVGHPGHKDRVHGHVLSNFSKEEKPLFEELCVRLTDSMTDILAGEENKAISQIAQNMQA